MHIATSGHSRRMTYRQVALKSDSVNNYSDSSDSDSPGGPYRNEHHSLATDTRGPYQNASNTVELYQNDHYIHHQGHDKYKHSLAANTKKYGQRNYVYPTPRPKSSRDSPRSRAERRLTFDSSDEFDSPHSFLSLKSNRSAVIKSPSMTPKQSSANIQKFRNVNDSRSVTRNEPKGSGSQSLANEGAHNDKNLTDKGMMQYNFKVNLVIQ